jgi:UDP-N-acetylmuramyl pentapeptide phosphotransferase/UDP-N-acetylglucosamine-1-phosphate transferase
MNTGIIALGFLTAFFVVLLATPSLIKVAKLKHLVDEPGESRKVHRRRVPTIGGVIIFSAILFGYTLWFPDDDVIGLNQALSDFKYIIASLLILFFVGVKDDIIGTAPVKKLIAHAMVAFILVMMAEIRITGMQGLFGVHELPDYGAVLLSFFVYIVIVNAFNLIDGLDGLAGGIGMIAGLFFGTWFILADNIPLALLSFSLAGALFGFLFFNFQPAKIFMGDSGSLTIGCIISILAIRMIEHPVELLPDELIFISKPILAMAILCYPLVDTLRVFIIRAVEGRSPFSADKKHIHHKILERRKTHAKTVVVIYAINIFVVIAAAVIGYFTTATASLILTAVAAGIIFMLPFVLFPKPKKS